MMSDDFWPTCLSTLFNPKTSNFLVILNPPTYPKIKRHYWTFPYRAFRSAQVQKSARDFHMVSRLDVCPIDIEGMEFGPTSDQMRHRQSVSTCDSAMSQASKV